MSINPHPVTQSRQGRIAVLTMAAPPVNAFSLALRTSLFEQLLALRTDPDVDAVVLHGQGRAFSAGGDIKEFGTPAATTKPGLSSDIHPLMESYEKPLVAAIHGIALGGGLETALACHYRIASTQAKIGLPEVRVGVIPLTGTQRLPRLMHLEDASRLILDAEISTAGELAHTQLFDMVIQTEPAREGEAVVAQALARTNDWISAPAPLPLVRNQPLQGGDYAATLNQMIRDKVFGHPAQNSAALALAAAANSKSFNDGIETARQLYDDLCKNPDSRARQRDFLQRP